MRQIELWHGDCLDLLPRVPNGSVNMVLADLPYGVTANPWDNYIELAALWRLVRACGTDNAAFVFTATQPFASTLIASQPSMFRYDLIWEKPMATGFFNAKKRPLRAHESVLVFYAKHPTFNPIMSYGNKKRSAWKRQCDTSTNYRQQKHTAYLGGDARYPRSVLTFSRDKKTDDGQRVRAHPTQKPVALMEWLIKAYTNPGDTVLDPTMGSGTTCVAAYNTGRKAIGIEQNRGYYDVAAERLRQVLGSSAPAVTMPTATPRRTENLPLPMWA